MLTNRTGPAPLSGNGSEETFDFATQFFGGGHYFLRSVENGLCRAARLLYSAGDITKRRDDNLAF
jgi:hypothetical protein